jgi:methyl-accepting chemotaxis protein
MDSVVTGRAAAVRMPVGVQLALAFGLLVALAAVVGGYALLAVGDLRGVQRQTADRHVPYLTGLSDAALAAKAAATDERGFLLSGDAKFATEAAGRRTAENAGLDTALTHAVTDAQRAAIGKVRTPLDRFNTALDAEFVLYGTDPAAATALAMGANRDLRKSYEQAIADAGTLARAQVAAAETASSTRAARTQWLLAGLLAVVVACGVSVAVVLARLVTRPLASTVRAMEAASGGDLTVRVRESGAREFRRMAQAANRMLEATGRTVATIAGTAATLSASATRITGLSADLTASAQAAAERTTTVSGAADRALDGVRAVATAGEELTATIREIAGSAAGAAGVAANAVGASGSARDIVLKLTTSSAEIGNVVKLITSIAEQTNLLALNATIEAARAGESGKGFAVVAGEVKDLAQETARATDSIARQIAAIQADTGAAMAAIDEIGSVIATINDHQTAIAGAVEEQAATTNEISRSADHAAASTTMITEGIASVADATNETKAHSDAARHIADELNRSGAELTTLVSAFRI